MDYRRIRIPFLKDIKNKANTFREKFWGDSIPVDMEEIIEIKLKISLMPLPDLQKSFGVDAFITSGWDLIYVDENGYKRFSNRLKFSLAHEIGHFVLHKDIYNSFKIKRVEDLRKFIEQIPQEQHKKLEQQASIFANNLLVPRQRLAIEKDRILRIKKNEFNLLEVTDRSVFNSYLAIPISKKFGVSEQVIQIALSDLDNRKND